MNLGLEDIRDLLEGFLSNSGGRRGRERERVRAEAGSDPGTDASGTAEAAAGEAGAATGTDASAAGGEPAAEPEPEPDSSGGSMFGRIRSGSGDADEETLDELYHRIEELEEELEDRDAQLGTIQDSQEQVADRVESVDDRIRQLLGVYDRVTDDVNPFTGSGEEERGFGIFGEDDADEGFGLEERADDETVSFADLKATIEEAAAGAEEPTEGRSTAQKISFDEETYIDGPGEASDGAAESADEADDSSVDVRAAESASRAGDPSDGSEGSTSDEDENVTLETLADTYASDVIVFEWLTELARTAGPAATLRAISYYHDIGWIGADVKTHLERVMSGPDLDVHVDPETAPEELTAEDHADSYTYIMKLQEVHETRREIRSREDA